MCARILLSLTTGMGAFVGAWFLLMSALTGEAYVSALEITPLAALAGLVTAVLAWLLMTPRRPATEAPQPARPARKLTDAHVALALTGTPSPPEVVREKKTPQPASIPEDTAAAWLAMDSRRKVWPKADRPASLAVPVIVRGRKALRYVSQDGTEHTMFLDGAK